MSGFAAYDSQIGETLWASLVHIRTEMTGSSDPRAGILQQSTDSVCLDPRGLRPLPKICLSAHVSGTFSQLSPLVPGTEAEGGFTVSSGRAAISFHGFSTSTNIAVTPVPYTKGALGAVSNISLQVG